MLLSNFKIWDVYLIHAYYTHHSDQPGYSHVPIKLNGTNYNPIVNHLCINQESRSSRYIKGDLYRVLHLSRKFNNFLRSLKMQTNQRQSIYEFCIFLGNSIIS